MGPTGGLASLASIGLSAYSKVSAAEGVKAADEATAARLDRAAEYGRTSAVETGAQLTTNLNQTLGNIDAIRAAAHDDPTSPTGVAVRGFVESQGTMKRNIAVENILAQTKQDEADANYMRQAGAYALLQGKIGAAAGALGTIAQTNPGSFGFPGGGGGGGEGLHDATDALSHAGGGFG